MNDLLKKTIDLGDLLKYIIPMIASIIGGYMIMSSRMQALELRYEFKDKRDDELMTELKEVKNVVLCIQLEMKDKQDRNDKPFYKKDQIFDPSLFSENK